ncbi:uncharacterized protein [Epargyreus clarus]|uniref:uncharacterized protein n=1 Tax=Epargyreus clarus TaxID=520877 RepID=UPI003C2E5639
MMQQPVFQQEQAGSSQAQQQQMLLCPVRLVYETQILVQPGDQIQPNQTILINPQNQPPWAQNRVQNQVIYVQNVPNNYMSQVQQHLDQNQMFLQQNYGFPQVIQHPMITQNQEQMRTTLQVGNVPMNIQSQVQQNIAQLMPNERIVHNYGHVQMNPGINVQNAVQNQIANVPISSNSRQVQVPKSIEMPNTIKQEVPQNYRQLPMQNYRHQTQMNVARTPVPQIAMIPMPNIVHKAEQNQAQISSIQQPIAPQVQQINTHQQTEPRKAMPVMQKVHNLPNTVSHAPKNQAYSYRPIQPRPEYSRPNIPAPAITVQPNMNSMNIQMQQNPNIIDVNRIAGPVTSFKVESNTQFNRKRKSESPDELHRKLTIVPQPATTSTMTVKRLDNPIAQSISVTKVNTTEIGVNTNPIVKMNTKISNPRNVIQISPIVDQNARIKEELAKPIYTPQIKPQIPTPAPQTIVTTTSTQVEKEKMVRNTVFTQARFGRLLTDKDDIPVNINTVKDTKETEKHKPMHIDVKTEKVTIKEPKKEEIQKEKQTEVPKEEPKVTREVKEEQPVTERNAEEKMLSDSMNRLKGSEANEIKFKNERDYILTHVLDGFVIQESNVAFPIRLPLREKTLAINAAKNKEKIKEDVEVSNTEVKAEKVPDLSHLNLSENERLTESEQKKEEEGNPFKDLKHCTVKTWTIEQLATHLSKFNWADTISVLQEHEIDGESLFLVSKSQLVTIGVKENHADVICEFVKS